jgi:hypothetical protein
MVGLSGPVQSAAVFCLQMPAPCGNVYCSQMHTGFNMEPQINSAIISIAIIDISGFSPGG